jgi:hypothetical protein
MPSGRDFFGGQLIAEDPEIEAHQRAGFEWKAVPRSTINDSSRYSRG